MITVEILRDGNQRICSFSCKGHAGYKKRPDDKDMVCAAVSAIVYGVLGYMEEYYKMKDFTQKDGFIQWIRPEGAGVSENDNISGALDAMAVGLKQIEMQYGNYLKVVDKEVI